jgi:hypothetical protein
MSTNPYAPSNFGPDAASFESQGDAESIRRAHISHEASIKSVGILYYLGGFITLMAALAVLLTAQDLPPIEVVVLLVVYLILGALGLVAGYGIRRLTAWGRIISAVFAVIGLIGVPIGTIINGYILWLIFSKKGQMVFSPEYKAIIEATPHVKYKTSLIVKVFLALLLLLILMGIIAWLASA